MVAGQALYLALERRQACLAALEMDCERFQAADRGSEPVVEGRRHAEETGSGVADVGLNTEALAQVTRRPDDPGYANRGQRYLRAQRGVLDSLLKLIGPESAQRDHRPDAGVQDVSSRFVDHHLTSP